MAHSATNGGRPTASNRDLVLSDEDLAEMEKRAEKATEGPWGVDASPHRVDIDGPDGGWLFRSGSEPWAAVDGYEQRVADAAFIAASRTSVPLLTAELARSRTALRQVRAAIEGRTGSVNVSVILSALGEQE